MKQIFKNFLYLFVLLSNLMVYSVDSIITITLQKYPYLSKKTIKELEQDMNNPELTKYSKALQQPDFLYKDVTFYKKKQQLPGIMCMYLGNIALSNPDGQITFPRLQQNPNMYILIAERIMPAYIVAPATVANWMVDVNQPTEMYFMKLEYDKKTNLSYYQTSKVDLPKDHNIPLNTLIFIADPQTMYVPLGATITNAGPNNIVLPTLYIKKDFCFIKNSLFTLATNQYFRNTHPSIKQEAQTVMMIQQPN